MNEQQVGIFQYFNILTQLWKICQVSR